MIMRGSVSALFSLGAGDMQTCVRLWEQLEMSDLTPVETKSETAAIEGLNSRIRYYLVRFHRKTFWLFYSNAQGTHCLFY